jgi:hypothetical protein
MAFGAETPALILPALVADEADEAHSTQVFLN